MGVKILADRPDDFKIFFSTPTRMVPTHSECVHHPPPLSTAITRSYRLHPVPWCWMLVAISYMPSSMPGPFAAVVMIGKGHTRQGRTQNGSGLPIPTNRGDQTKNQVVLHVEHPTKPYQDRCPPCETDWWIWIGLPTLTSLRIWPAHRHGIALPTLTSRGVEHTQ